MKPGRGGGRSSSPRAGGRTGGEALRAERLLALETGTIRKDAPLRVALVYPSPYRLAMASLGFQVVYRLVNERPGACCERATLESPAGGEPLRTLETGRPVADCPVVALSVATEAEVALAARALEQAGLPPLETDRRGRQDLPLVVAGGPLTYADGSPLLALADVVLAGEAEESLLSLLDLAERGHDRDALLEAAAELPGAGVAATGCRHRPEPVACDDRWLPAYGAVTTPESELRDMFLVEPARGCPRRCSFCVMERRRLRLAPAEEVLARVPASARRVGLVGSAVGSHPELGRMLESLVRDGRQVSLSSIRADLLDEETVDLLVRGGARSLTVAADGASQRLRRAIRKRVTEEQLIRAARLAAARGLRSVKLYAMVGLPNETDEDLHELTALASEMAGYLPVSLALSPFVPKAGTSLEAAPFAPLEVIRARLGLVRRALGGRLDLRAASVREAEIEAAVARGGFAAGLAAVAAARGGCSYRAWRRALVEAGLGPVPTSSEPGRAYSGRGVRER